MRTTSEIPFERAVKRTTIERMQREVGVRSFKFERGARRLCSKSLAGFSDFGGVRHEERMSSEVSIARIVGNRRTASVWFLDSAARSMSNQSLEPTALLVTIRADHGCPVKALNEFCKSLSNRE